MVNPRILRKFFFLLDACKDIPVPILSGVIETDEKFFAQK